MKVLFISGYAKIDVMLLCIRVLALKGNQEVIRSQIEHFGSKKFARKLVSRSKK